jgi:ATP-dependent RNA helicase DDX52/ROK1
VAISPTGTGKTLAYLVPIFSKLAIPASSSKTKTDPGVRAMIIVPTRELAHQIHNECLKLAQGRKWKVVLFSKTTANALSQGGAQDNVGGYFLPNHYVLERVTYVVDKSLYIQT